MLTYLLILVGLVVLNSYFVAAEFALVRARPTRLDAMARGGDGLAGIALRASKQIPLVLSACQTGVTVCGLGLGWVSEEALVSPFSDWMGSLSLGANISIRVTIATVLALVAMTFITVVFGELTPKYVALNNPEKWARYLIPPLLAFAWVMRPFTWLLNRSSQLVLRALNQKPMTEEDAVHSPEEIRMLVEQSEESGALEKEDAALIDAVFEFSEKNAREVMTPRTDIIALDVDSTMEEIMQTIHESGRSRFPVYRETIDDIIGVLLVKDMIRVLANPDEKVSLEELIRPPHFVPGTREVEDVLADFKHRKEHMAIVLDEYGGTAGVVTMEDLLEEIVGEILDEYDASPPAMLTSTGETLIPGNTNIGELNEEYGLDIPEDESYTTIGGCVFGMLGYVPSVGDWVTIDNTTFTVREMEGRRIATLALSISPDEKDSETAPPL